MINRFSKSTIEQLKYYVYLYSDPDTKEPFYVGKGQRNRCFDHLKDSTDSNKTKKIKELKKLGKEPVIELLAWGLDEDAALAAEQVAIDLLHIDNLTNIQRGHGAQNHGRISVDILERRLSAEKATDAQWEKMKRHGVLLIRLSLYHPGMSDLETYEVTRSAWRLNREHCEKMNYAFAVYQGRIIETYRVLAWFSEGATFNSRMLGDYTPDPNRLEFVGQIDEKMHAEFADLDIGDRFSKGAQSSVIYLEADRE